jgi:hypothetical protein
MNRPPSHQPGAERPAAETGVLRDTLAALWIAWWRTRLFGQHTDVSALLPPVSAPRNLGQEDAQRIFQRVDRIVRVAVFWKFSKRCFYRSFAAASVLRLRGLPVRLDFGLRLAGSRRKQCHCWITVGGQPLGEAIDPRKQFPIPAGQWNEDVHYWLADSKPQ